MEFWSLTCDTAPTWVKRAAVSVSSATCVWPAKVWKQEFDKVYQKFTQSILDDWSRFSNISVDYMDKLFEEGLTDDETNKFNHISNNLFARFQAFNNLTATVSDLKTIQVSLLPIKTKLKEAIESFERDNTKMSSKILDSTEIDISL